MMSAQSLVVVSPLPLASTAALGATAAPPVPFRRQGSLQAIFGARPRLEREASLPVGLSASYQPFAAASAAPNPSPQGSISAAANTPQDGSVAPNWGTYMKTMRFVHLMKKHTRTPSNSETPLDTPKLSDTLPAPRPSFLRAQSMSSMLAANNFSRTQPLSLMANPFPPSFNRQQSIPTSPAPSFASTTNLSNVNIFTTSPTPASTTSTSNADDLPTTSSLQTQAQFPATIVQPEKLAHELKKEVIRQKQNDIRRKMLDKMKATNR